MGLRERDWRRFVRGPDETLLEDLYIPALSQSVRYDRSCAYFSSSVLAAAARGFGPLIERLLEDRPKAAETPIRFFVNEQLSRRDVEALLEGGPGETLAKALLAKLWDPQDALEKERLGMLGFLYREKLLDLRVGIMRSGEGIVHAKFGIFIDKTGDAVVFNGSGNESEAGWLANYEELEVSPSWVDKERLEYFRQRFETLWNNKDADVATFDLPDAVRLELIKYAQESTSYLSHPDRLRADRRRRETVMRWQFVCEAPYFESGGPMCDATAMVDPWPHQRRVVEESAQAWPEGRLLCDEVGMGKTIEAILAIRRLLTGRGVERVLFLLPAGLLQQWQGELREKGGLVVPRLEGQTALVWPDSTVERINGLGQALSRDLVLVSRETARLEQNAQTILNGPPWDLILLDEAHAARRANQEEREFNSATLLLKLLRQLQLHGKARGFLLLSATPMQTHPWEPWDLVSVLGEGPPWLSEFSYVRDFYTALAVIEAGPCPLEVARGLGSIVHKDIEFPQRDGVTSETLPQRLAFASTSERPALARWLRTGTPLGRRMHRNTRDTLRAYYERGLIASPPPRRDIDDRRFEYGDPAERTVYDAITSYVTHRFEELEAERPGKGFVMTVYRRRASSSPYALEQSLNRRADGLRRVIQLRAADPTIATIEGLDTLDLDDLPEGERLGQISSALPQHPVTARNELRDVERILNQLSELRGIDTKCRVFHHLLVEVMSDGRPVLVFSEYADTVTYIRESLFPRYGRALACYTGDGGQLWSGTNWKGVSKAEITSRLRRGEIRVLLCTDAASEGLNLQTAGAVINYDLPWNPSRVEQRIGRIDRIGQQAAEVRIVNLFLRDSVDDRVYQVLRQRCGMFEHFVGPMQPVLAQARAMLLGTARFDPTVLNGTADTAQADQLAHAAFVSSTAPPASSEPPGVVREDVERVFAEVVNDGTIHVAGRDRRVTADQKELERDPTAWPLTPWRSEFRALQDTLVRSGERLPLVIGSHCEGPFRAAVTAWCRDGKWEIVERLERLEAMLGEWDGRFVDPALRVAAENEARRLAKERVDSMWQRADVRQRRGLQRQVEAAWLRLLRELARYLLCLDPEAADLNQIYHAQRIRDIASAARLGRVHDRVGYPAWDEQLIEEMRSHVRALGANQRQSILLGKPLDAALADPRWVAADLLEGSSQESASAAEWSHQGVAASSLSRSNNFTVAHVSRSQ